MSALVRISNQLSWELVSDQARLALTRTGGHMGPVVFRLGRRLVTPYSVAPWAGEKLPGSLPSLLKVLRGDFFCAPFGGNARPFRGEKHPPHGEPANAAWKCEGFIRERGTVGIHAALEMRARPGRVDKYLSLRKGETVVYARHVLSGMNGPMCFGTHPMLRFPERDGAGCVSTSALRRGWVFPEEFEKPEEGGYQALMPGGTFERLDKVPQLDGGMADLSSYPARRGFEDLVLLVHEANPDFAWSCVTYPLEGYAWFCLKDPRVLRSTILWHSNGGRHYAPWNGRHIGVLGIEDVTAFFHYGLAESARPNFLTRAGIPTSVTLEADKPLVVNSIQGVAHIPSGFQRVHSITPSRNGICLQSKSGRSVEAALDLSFLYAG